MKKKVAIMIHKISGGGAEKVAAQLSVMLYEMGYQVYLFLDCPYDKQMYKHKGRIIDTGGIYFEKGIINQIVYFYRKSKQIKSLKNTHKIDLTISMEQNTNLINILSKKKKGKIILMIHNVASKRSDMSHLLAYQKYIYKYFYRYANQIVAVCEFSRRDLIKSFGVKKEKIMVICNTNGLTKKELTNRNNDQYDKNMILSVNRLSEVKQLHHIVKGFAEAKKKYPSLQLFLVGEGQCENKLRKLSQLYNLEDSIHFEGFQMNVDQYYRKALVLINSSKSEALPCTMLEAMSHGLPIIAGECPGGIKELINHNQKMKLVNEDIRLCQNGILLPAFTNERRNNRITNQEKKLAQAIILLYEKKEFRREISQNCIKNSNDHSEEVIFKQWTRIIDGLL